MYRGVRFQSAEVFCRFRAGAVEKLELELAVRYLHVDFHSALAGLSTVFHSATRSVYFANDRMHRHAFVCRWWLS